MTEIFLNKNNTLEFSLLLEGTDSPLTDARLTFTGVKPYISFPAQVNNGKLSFNLSNMKKYFEPGLQEAKLEVMVDNNYFVTYTGVFDMKMPMEILLTDP